MREYSIQENADSQFLCLKAEPAKIFFRSEHGIDAGVIRGVVFMVAAGVKDGGEIEHRNPEIMQVRQLLADAFEIAAEEVLVSG